MYRIYDKVEIIGYIEDEILSTGEIPYRLAREAKNRAYRDEVAYNLMIQYMKIPNRRTNTLRVLESYLKREGVL